MKNPRRVLAVLLTLACSLLLTLAAWMSARSDARAEARSRFDLRAAEIVLAIKGRMLDYEQVLRGGVGLFAASERVEEGEWRAYVRAIQIERTYPGVVGLGYAAWHDGRAPITYLEPQDEPNRRAIGYDMASEPVRRAAIERARDSGAAAITRSITLVQDAGSGARDQSFLMFLPVYRNGAPTGTLTERRAALAGFVYAPFRYSELMAGSVGAAAGLHLRLLDASEGGTPVELHQSGGETRRDLPLFTRAETFPAAQRSWRLEVSSQLALEAEVSSQRPALTLASGIAISALLVLIVWTILSTQERARELARHMTSALRASEGRLQLALASSHLALFDWDVEAGLVQLSSEWSVMLGGPPEPTMTPARKLQLLVHPEDSASVREQIRHLLSGDVDHYRIEHRVRRLDGSWKWIESSAQVNERGKDGRALRVTGANADITERKAVEELKNAFIATVSHELRTPLTSMMASLALMREGAAGELPADARQFVEIAYANTERLTALVNDILDIESIESGGVVLNIADVPLDEVLGRALELNAAYAEGLGTRYESRAAPGLAVRADSERLLQVLTNLMSNAAKYSPKGVPVTVAAEARDGMVRVSVSDQGPGIPAEFRSRLFGKFEQAGDAKPGTGLGLAISKALVERMDGKIGCDSEPGQGSTFWFELPRAA